MATAVLEQQRTEPTDGQQRPAVRGAIAVLVSRFPVITETFILREIIEMERQGQPVVLVPLIREYPSVIHPEVEPWVRRALFTPFISWDIVAANLRALRRPVLYAAVLARTVLGSVRSFNVLIRSIALFPKSVYLADRLRIEGVQHVHAHFATHPTTTALIISRLTGITFSFTIHAHDVFVPWRRALMRTKIKNAGFVRAISEMNRSYLRARYPDASGSKIEVIHVGIEPERYESHPPALLDTPTSHGSRCVRLLSVAALQPYKGLPFLLEACQRLKDDGVAIHCDIVGQGPLHAQLDQLRREMGLEEIVTLLGPKTQDEVAALMARASVFVLPSVVAPDGQMEGIPVALMEAMATGTPVVASELSGITELVQDGASGFVVQPGDAASIHAAIRRLVEDPALASRMGRTGKAMVDREFRLETCVSNLLDQFDAHRGGPRTAPGPDHSDAAGALFPTGHVGIRRVLARHDSTVLHLLISRNRQTQDSILKIHNALPGERRSAADRARHEFDVLKALSSELGVRGGIPKPAALYEPAAALSMEACSGSPLVSLIREARRSLDSGRTRVLRSALSQTGSWLRSFQDGTTPGGDVGDVLDQLFAQAIEDLDVCRGRDVPVARAVRVSRRLEALYLDSKATSLASTWCHGDFGPGNILVGDEGVQVIDFEAARSGVRYEDVAYFLIELQAFYAYPFLNSRFQRLASEFLGGYRRNNVLDPATYALCRTAKALQVLARSHRSRRTGLREWRRRRALRRIVLED